MAVKPIVYPQFAILDLNNGTGAAPNVAEPIAGKKDTGWNEGERPARETFNWLHRITNDWIEWFDQELGTGGVTGSFAELPALHSGLQFFCSAGGFTFGGVLFNEVQTATTCADNTLNYIYYKHGSLDVLVSGGAFPGNKDEIPLFIVTTLAGAITAVSDVRTIFNMQDIEASILDEHEIRTAGDAQTRVELNQADTTPTPDCALGDFFTYSPSNAVNSMQLPINADALDAANQTQTIRILITNGPGETTSFNFAQYNVMNSFTDQQGLATILGEGIFLCTFTFDATGDQWYGRIDGPGFDVNTPNTLRKVKTTNETKSVTGVTDDADLVGFTLPPGLYRVSGFLGTGFTPGNGGLDLNWEEVSGSFGIDNIWVTTTRTSNTSPFLTEGGVFFVTNFSDLTIPDNGINDTAFITIAGNLEVTAAAVLDFQWAPVNAALSGINKGSWIEFERIGDV